VVLQVDTDVSVEHTAFIFLSGIRTRKTTIERFSTNLQEARRKTLLSKLRRPTDVANKM
jgi:hypothetical protein